MDIVEEVIELIKAGHSFVEACRIVREKYDKKMAE